MLCVNFVTFAFCKLFSCHDSLETFVGINAFKVLPFTSYQTKNISSQYSTFAHFWCYQLISEHFDSHSTASGCEMAVH